MKPKLLFLFPDGWDRIAFASTVGWRDEFDIVCEGFDLFRFPESANILWFDACRFIIDYLKTEAASLAPTSSTAP